VETIIGITPAGRKERQLDLWVDPASADGLLNLWIHQPNSSNDDGWQIRVRPSELREALRRLELPEFSA